MTDFDKSIRPQDDFFGYVNNNWIKDNPIPADQKGWGHFGVLREKSIEAINEIVDDILKSNLTELDHSQILIRSFFESGMSYSKNRQNQLATLKSEIDKINNMTNKKEIPQYLGYAHRLIGLFWETFVSIDDMDSQSQLLFFSQSGLSLPNRDYYLEKTKNMENIRNKYKEYFQKMTTALPGLIPNNFDVVFKIEKMIAESSWPEAELRDAHKNYNKFKISDLKTKYPSFNWQQYFYELGWKNPNNAIIIGQPSFIEKSLVIINGLPLDEIKSYLCFRVLDYYGQFVDESIQNIRFEFYGKIIDGKKELQPLWKRIVGVSNMLVIGEALGQEYANRHFPESSKKDVLDIANNIVAAYHKRIDNSAWMTKITKTTAHKKLDNIKILIGYPSEWKDLSALSYSNNNFLNNIITTENYMHQIDIEKIGKIPPAEDWHMNAHTVNAYFSPSRLEICFPAGILQPPFFDANASYATNLGGIGTVIGHELTHGFDDQGAKYDEFGNLNDWQTKSEQKQFKALSKGLVMQADKYEILPGIFMDGNLVLGEAIADIGGIELAVEALAGATETDNMKDNLRKLFVGYAVIECSAERDESLEQSAKTDPHPPGKFRVNNTLKNVDKFYHAYDIAPTDKLYLAPKDRIRIW